MAAKRKRHSKAKSLASENSPVESLTYLKPGGVLVYATCTLSRAENERNIEFFLAEHPEFELQEAARYLPIQARQMVRDKFFQALPQRDHTDGFFAARMRKAS